MKNNNDGVIQYKDYVACWFDSSISDFMAHFPSNSKAMSYALITSLDSDLTPRKLLVKSPELKSLSKAAKPLGDGFVVPTSLILGENSSIFYGFDEIWFFPHDKITPKPKKAWLVGPNRVDQHCLDKLGSWITDNECSLAMGDGDGLNFIIKAHGLVKFMLAYSMFQPQPENGGEVEELERFYGST